MKNLKSVFLITLLLLLTLTSLHSTAEPVDGDGIVLVRVYESGWVRSVRGVYVFYPDGKRDKTEIIDDLDPIGNAQKVADALNKVSKMGYTLYDIYKLQGSGVNRDYYYVEYIFKKGDVTPMRSIKEGEK